MSIMSFVGLDMLMGLDTPKLIVPTEFKVFDFSPNYVQKYVFVILLLCSCFILCACYAVMESKK